MVRATFGSRVNTVGTFGLRAIVGGSHVTYTVSQGHEFHILGIFRSEVQLIIIGICAAALILIHWLLKCTRLGKAMRATSANRNLVRNSGVKTQFVIAMSWIISGELYGLAGTVFALNSGDFEAKSNEPDTVRCQLSLEWHLRFRRRAQWPFTIE